LFWGLFFFLVLVFEKMFLSKWLLRLPVFLQHGYTLILVLVSWTIFALEDSNYLLGFMRIMCGCGGVPLINMQTYYYLKQYLPILCIAVVASTPVGVTLVRKIPLKIMVIVEPVLLFVGLLVCTAYLVAETYNPFLYFRF
jgi:alginate O-acetyltransferase complex protein AlgI